MKAFVAILALVATVAADAPIQQPNVYLQPPVEHYPNKDFNAPWTAEQSWTPVVDHQQSQHVVQQSSYYAPVHHGNYHHENKQEHQQAHQQSQQSSYYAPAHHGNYNQDYKQDHQQAHQQHYYQHHEQSSYQHQPTYQSNDVPSSVSVQVTHPDWATSYSNVNRYNTFWPAAPMMIAPVQFVPAAPVYAAPAPFSKPTQAPTPAPVTVYNHNVAKWNTWNNQPAHDISKVPLTVAKYVAITPGSVHIAPLPGHTVSHKILNVAPAVGSW